MAGVAPPEDTTGDVAVTDVTELPPEYWGIFNVLPTSVAAPLVPVVVSVIALCLPLNVDQSVEVR